MPKRFPLAPAHPERNCWGCDQYCAATDMRCGNGSVRTPHPVELFGEDWFDGAPDLAAEPAAPGPARPSRRAG
jgi:hypothetical protein